MRVTDLNSTIPGSLSYIAAPNQQAFSALDDEASTRTFCRIRFNASLLTPGKKLANSPALLALSPQH
jgi:hypothetical protein